MSSNDNNMITNVYEYSVKKDTVFATEAKANPSGMGKTNGMTNRNTRCVIRWRFPMLLTWGAQPFTDSNGKLSYSMSMQFPGDGYTTAQTDKALETITEMEELVLDYVIANWTKLFNKPKPSREAAEAMYTRSLKYKRDKETGEIVPNCSPTFKVKLSIWEGKFDFELYTPDGTLMFSKETQPNISPVEVMNLIPKASQAAVILQCGGIWFAGGKFGVTWKLFQGIVKPKPSFKGKCMITLTPEDSKIISTQELPPNEDNDFDDSITSGLKIADDSDDEFNPVKPVPVRTVPVRQAPALEPAPEPAPTPTLTLTPAPEPAPTPTLRPAPAPAPAPTPVKKTLVKSAPVKQAPIEEPVVEAQVVEAPVVEAKKKTTVKRKVVVKDE
jgi:hypothetical protein